MRTTKILLCLALVATTFCQAPLEELRQNNKGYLTIKNAEFLFTGGIHVKNDKYWCLHKAVYRQPDDKRVSTAQKDEGRKLQALECDSGCHAMSDFLCSNSHLEFTDNPAVCKAMALTLGQKWRPFFTIEQFRIKFAHGINYHYKMLKNIKNEPKSTYAMRKPKFLKGCDKQIQKEMTDLMNYLNKADIKYCHDNNMKDDVIEYVLLNVEDLFVKDKITAADAWRNSYSVYKQKTAGKKFSEYSVRYFIEDIRLRYKPRTDIPTPNQEKLGIPVFGPEKLIPEPKPEFPDLFENPPTDPKIQFEYKENIKDFRNFLPYSKKGDAPTNTPKTPKTPPKNPPSSSSGTTTPPKEKKPVPPLPETPGGIYEKSNTKPPKPTESEPEEKPIVPPTKKNNKDSDKMTRIEIIEIQRSYNIQKALINYDSLTTSMKRDIRACGLSLKGAMGRCEGVHGQNNCEAVTPTYVAPKCPTGTKRIGCCSCGVPTCPKGFVYDKLFCKKPKTYFTNPRATAKDCYMANAVKCEKVGSIFSAKCKEGYKRIGSALCTAVCPKGTIDMGDSCYRQPIRVGDIFAWSAGDE